MVQTHSEAVFIMLSNVKMPTIVGILTFMNRINFVLSWVVHVLPSGESARMPAEVYMLTQAQHDLVYQACLLGQLLILWPARPWAKASQSLPIFPAKHDPASQPANMPARQLWPLPTARPRANASRSLPNFWAKNRACPPACPPACHPPTAFLPACPGNFDSLGQRDPVQTPKKFTRSHGCNRSILTSDPAGRPTLCLVRSI